MGPVTTNPWLISIINMTIVFGVLACLLYTSDAADE